VTDISSLTPISHWTCDETSGVRYDSNTTNSNDLTDNNTVGYANGLRGNACDFESSNNEYLSISDASQSNLEPTDFAISAWVNKESNQFYILGKSHSTSHAPPYFSYQIGFGGDSPYPAAASIPGDPLLGSSGTSNSVWYHIVETYNEAVHKLYVNGTEIDTSTYSTPVSYSDGQFVIGCHASYCNSGYFFDGLVDEVTIDNEYWDATTVASVYNSGTPLPYVATSTPPSSSTSTATAEFSTDPTPLNLFLFTLLFFLSFTSAYWLIRKLT